MLVESVGMYAIRFIIILSYLYITDYRLLNPRYNYWSGTTEVYV